jgi:glycosyl transferase family 2
LSLDSEIRSDRPLQRIGAGECLNQKVQSVAKSLSIIFPAFNEEENIRVVVEDACRILPKFAPVFEIIVVNDGSKDRTGEICDSLAVEFPDVRVVHHAENRGYGAALKTGIERARYDVIFFTDSDGQFDLREVATLLEQTDAYDIVAGYRARRHDPPHRLLFAWGWNILVRRVLAIKTRDIDCAFKAFKRHVFDSIQIHSVGAMVNAEIFAQASAFGMTVKEVPVSHFPRRHGEPTGDNVAVISKAFRELTGMRRSLRTITPDQLGLFREDSAQRESSTNQSPLGIRPESQSDTEPYCGPHLPATMPFGFVTRMVALWRASATNANSLTLLPRRMALLSTAVIAISTVGAVHEARQHREEVGERFTNEFAIADSAMQDELLK